MKPEHYPLQPKHLWEHFYQFTQIPRPSKQEEAIRQYVIEQAEESACEWKRDSEGNLTVYVPASPGKETRPTIIVQNHLDMVTVKTLDRVHDFNTDPLQLQVENGWLSADRTTLGADNGAGCAAALALMTDSSVSHPPLELLFTVDEETGLGGALNLDPALLSGTLMLNLDTEDWNELYIGCAGGGGWEFTRQFDTHETTAGHECQRLVVKGLAGGHSGVQIHQQLGNAIKIACDFLGEFVDCQLAEIDAGVAHNVIPREAAFTFSCPTEQVQALRQRLSDLRKHYLGFLPEADNGLELMLDPAENAPSLSSEDSRTVLDLLHALPHGAQAYSLSQPADLVDLSINLAMVKLKGGALFIESSYRFFNEEQSLPLCRQVEAIARSFRMHTRPVEGYPGWQPDFSSALLATGKLLHQRLFGFEPEVKAIHAGLECGILKSKKPDVDILSFGPTIRGAHSPSERLKIDTVEPFWEYLCALMEEL